MMSTKSSCHNPYFNRWFSAILILIMVAIIISGVTILILIDGFLQLRKGSDFDGKCGGHNPYFNRWFSAIERTLPGTDIRVQVTILILIDGFLQYRYKC